MGKALSPFSILFDVYHTDGISCAYENYDHVNFATFPLQIRNALYYCNHERQLPKF